MTLEALFLLIERALGAILTVLGIVQSMEENPTAKEGTPYNIENHATDIHVAILDESFGLSALSDQIAAVRHDTSADPRPDLDVIFETLLALTPVTLPEEPPPGYGTGDLSAVWLSNLETYDWCPID